MSAVRDWLIWPRQRRCPAGRAPATLRIEVPRGPCLEPRVPKTHDKMLCKTVLLRDLTVPSPNPRFLGPIVKVKVDQLRPTLCDPKDHTVHGIL